MAKTPDYPLPSARPVLDTDLIKSFVTVAETGSFSRASERLFRTPSAISMQMKKLEEMLGTKFFERNGRGVALTTDGDDLLTYGRRILRLSEEAVMHFTVPELSGIVRIGIPDDFAPHLLPEAFCRFATSNSSVQVEIICDMSMHLLQMLDDDKVDMVLVTNESGHGTRPGYVVMTEPLVWAGRKTGEAALRRPLPLALCQEGCSWRRMAVEALDSAGIDRNIAYLSRLYAGQRSVLMADLAIAPLPRSFAQGDLCDVTEEGDLPPLGSYELRLVRRKNGKNPAHDALECHILDSFRPYAPSPGEPVPAVG